GRTGSPPRRRAARDLDRRRLADLPGPRGPALRRPPGGAPGGRERARRLRVPRLRRDRRGTRVVKVVVYGMNHRTAPVEVRERFAVEDVGPLLRKLADRSE